MSNNKKEMSEEEYLQKIIKLRMSNYIYDICLDILFDIINENNNFIKCDIKLDIIKEVNSYRVEWGTNEKIFIQEHRIAENISKYRNLLIDRILD